MLVGVAGRLQLRQRGDDVGIHRARREVEDPEVPEVLGPRLRSRSRRSSTWRSRRLIGRRQLQIVLKLAQKSRGEIAGRNRGDDLPQGLCPTSLDR